MITRYERQEIIDIETGEILKNYNKREYITVKIEKTSEKHGDNNWIKTKRIVRSNGQQKLFID